MKKIFVFGNPLLQEDFIALKVSEELRKKNEFRQFKFEEIDSLGELKEIPEDLVILDCAGGIEKISVFNDLKFLQGEKKFSLHDFDLGTELLLFEKIGKLKGKKITIIAIPQKMELQEAVKAVSILLLKNE